MVEALDRLQICGLELHMPSESSILFIVLTPWLAPRDEAVDGRIYIPLWSRDEIRHFNKTPFIHDLGRLDVIWEGNVPLQRWPAFRIGRIGSHVS